MSLLPAEGLSAISKAPKAQRATFGCYLIRGSQSLAVHAPSNTDAPKEPSREKREDRCRNELRSDAPCRTIGTFLQVWVI